MNVLVCGSNYGSTYIRALSQAQSQHTLIGVFSRGSQHSQTIAKHVGVPHFTDIEQLNANEIDIACVAIGGETGLEIAIKLLQLGIHVIAEHPHQNSKVKKALEVANTHNSHFFINAHFADLNAPQSFLQGMYTAKQAGECLHYELSANLRTLYSCLDILGRSHGCLNNIKVHAFDDSQNQSSLFSTLKLSGKKLSISLTCQRFSSDKDDGSANLLNHRVSASFMHGNLLLSESNGPTLWFPSPATMPIERWQNVLPVNMDSLNQIDLLQQRDLANLMTINKMSELIHTGKKPFEQTPDYLLQLSTLWQKVIDAIYPDIKET